MSNITIACIALAVFSVSSTLGGIVLIVLEVLESKRGQKGAKGTKGTKPPVWFHSMDTREEVERMKGEEMTVYRCDKCGEIRDHIGEMYSVTIEYAGKAHVNIPMDGRFHLCSSCERELLEQLHAYEKKQIGEDEE